MRNLVFTPHFRLAALDASCLNHQRERERVGVLKETTRLYLYARAGRPARPLANLDIITRVGTWWFREAQLSQLEQRPRRAPRIVL